MAAGKIRAIEPEDLNHAVRSFATTMDTEKRRKLASTRNGGLHNFQLQQSGLDR